MKITWFSTQKFWKNSYVVFLGLLNWSLRRKTDNRNGGSNMPEHNSKITSFHVLFKSKIIQIILKVIVFESTVLKSDWKIKYGRSNITDHNYESTISSFLNYLF